jgi:PAS domain S-box-containing protein
MALSITKLKLTIRKRLLLVISVLLVSVLLIFGAMSYLAVRKTSLNTGEERVQTLSQQVSSMLASNLQTMLSVASEESRNTALKAYLSTNTRDSLKQVAKWLENIQADTAYVQADLLNAQLIRNIHSSRNLIGLPVPTETLQGMSASKNGEAGAIGKLTVHAGTVYYPVVTAITEDDRLLGYLVKWRKMRQRTRASGPITQLMGGDVNMLVGNDDGSLWTDMVKPVPPLALSEKDRQNLFTYTAVNGNKMIVSVKPVPYSTWLVAIEIPEHRIIAAANNSLFWMVFAAVILLLVGVLVAWLVSGNMTRPLNNLIQAASSIAAGHYSPSAAINRFDELGKLARAFDAMAAKVKEAQETLQREADNYKLLFEKNPMPMWILCRSTFNIMDVNQSALDHYGYNRSEFLRLNAKDLRPDEDVQKYLEFARKQKPDRYSGIWRHKTKDGRQMMVEIIAEDIMYEGHMARLILANNVTEKLKLEDALVQQRIRQQELITETTIQAQEKEREEIGKELHDNINQILTSTKLYLEMAQSGNEALATRGIKKGYDNVNLAIREIRQLSKQLVPPALDSTLLETLKGLAEEVQAASSVRLNLSADSFDESLLSDKLQIIIYRIVQEQINNILKHAAASQAGIVLRTDDRHVHIQVTDDGAGFDTSQKAKGIGLRNIHSRVKFYKGSVRITSEKLKGCRLDVKIPLWKTSAIDEQPVTR